MVGATKSNVLTILLVTLILLAAGSPVFHGRILNAASPAVAVPSNIVYYHSLTWQDTRWLGVPLDKYPSDLLSYQEIIYETKPDVLIEFGTYMGGSALYFASLFDLLGKGRVITMDMNDYPENRNIRELNTY